MELTDFLKILALGALFSFLTLLLLAFIFRKKLMLIYRLIRDFGRLGSRALTDPDAPAAVKVIPILILLYLVLPADVVPDVVPLLGQLDDLGLIMFALHALLSPERIAAIEARWPGSQETFSALRKLAVRRKR